MFICAPRSINGRCARVTNGTMWVQINNMPYKSHVIALASSDYSTAGSATKDDPFHPFNNPSELQGEGIFAQFVFLVYISFILNFQLQRATGQFKMQTADCRLDIKCRLQTGYKMHTEYKTLCFC